MTNKTGFKPCKGKNTLTKGASSATRKKRHDFEGIVVFLQQC